MNDEYALSVLTATARILSQRIMMAGALFTTFVLAVWAMADPSWVHAGVAGGYGVLAWVYVNVPGIFNGTRG